MTSPPDDQPTALLDEAIALAQAGQITSVQLISAFLESVVVVPSGTPIDTPGATISPVLVPRGDAASMAVFATLEAAEAVSHLAVHAATLLGKEVVAGLDDGLSLIVNPGGVGFEIDAEIAASIRASLAASPDQDE